MAAISERFQDRHSEDEEEVTKNGGSDSDFDSDDTESDPTFSVLEETSAKFSGLSIKKKSKSLTVIDADLVSETDPDEMGVDVPKFEGNDLDQIQNIIQAGKVDKLKVDQCKIYLRKNGLRLTGNKETLVKRIKEHLEILSNGGENIYPWSSFVLNCKGDSCTGDVVMFEQKVYEMFSIASRSASGPPIGIRIVAGRIVKESYGAAKQQHTFTIEVLWSKGEKPLTPLHPLLIKGRNLYKMRTSRQRWENEDERQKVIMEKHSRGCLARSERNARVLEKEKRKVLQENRVTRKENGHSKNQCRQKPTIAGASTAKNQQSGLSSNPEKPASHQHVAFHAATLGKPVTLQRSGSSANLGKLAISSQQFHLRERGAQEVQHPIHINMQTNHNRPIVCMNGHQAAPSYTYQSTNWSESYRQPLSTMNCFPVMRPRQQGDTQQKLCRYYAQGRRCPYGDTCRFSHDMRGGKPWMEERQRPHGFINHARGPR